MADWLKNGCRGCFVGACRRAAKPHTANNIQYGYSKIRSIILLLLIYNSIIVSGKAIQNIYFQDRDFFQFKGKDLQKRSICIDFGMLLQLT